MDVTFIFDLRKKQQIFPLEERFQLKTSRRFGIDND